jgi:ABC-type antimicrobial peptide transport system permease subunit
VQATLTVSGIGFVPQTEYNEYDEGAWVSPATYQRLFGTGFVNHEALLGLRPGADAGQVAERLRAAFASIPNSFLLFISYPSTIDRAGEMADLRDLPLVLCVFLAVLGLAATGHVLLVSVQRRSGEFAVLRALGMTPRQARRIPSTQAVVYALAGLAAGVPIGIAAGRLLWRLVSDQTPLAYRTPDLGWSLVILIALTLGAGIVLAIPLARRVGARRIAEVLRAE